MTFIVNFDRFLMGFTLASHILIVTMSIGLSIIVSLAEYIGIRRKDPYYEALARRLTIALVVFFCHRHCQWNCPCR
jgi:cytochrome d ubiquinol oxidase subunit I